MCLFHCNICDKTYNSIRASNTNAINNHNKTKTHLAIIHRNTYGNHAKRNYKDNTNKYHCKVCNKYITEKKSVIEAHNQTNKHIELSKTYVNNDIDYDPKQIDKFFCELCESYCQNSKWHIQHHTETKKHQKNMKNKTYGV